MNYNIDAPYAYKHNCLFYAVPIVDRNWCTISIGKRLFDFRLDGREDAAIITKAALNKTQLLFIKLTMSNEIRIATCFDVIECR